MWRSILGQTVYQMVMMTMFLYLGPIMFDIEYDLINTEYYLTSNDDDLNGLTTSRTVHYTFLFQTFMFMNLFNQFNCRKLGLKEYNICAGIHRNLTFIIVVFLEFVATLAIVNLGGYVFRTTPIPFAMFLTSWIVGLGSLIIGLILKATPEKWVERLKI